MDKNEFIDAVAKQKGISRGKAYRSVEAVMDTIRILIMQGEEIKIGGLQYFLLSLALGKAFGSILYYTIFGFYRK